MRIAPPVELKPEQRIALERLARQRSLPARVVERARIVLRAADGLENQQIAQQMSLTPEKVSRWRKRFLKGGMAALQKDAPRPGRKRTLTDPRVKQILEMTLEQTPANATHWSTRTMAEAAGISEASVRRIWHAHGLKPHLVRTFKLSRDPAFGEKLQDIVGLYLNPPEHALVLCADEKSQIQALDRTQPGLPMKKGRCGTMTHDYKRHGTATLFAALDTLQGHVISMYDDRHRHQEWLKFLRAIDWVVPADLQIHMIVDNYSTHKHPKVQRWLQRHPRFHMHFTPTGCSWLNMVERFFRDLTQNRLRRGIFRSVEELIVAMDEYIRRHNQAPKPFIWTAKATDILEKVKRARVNLHNPHSA
ncbi:MAG TPA: IS630 family transposase [Candidatus Angelobacter sp.]|nr:IS630 family transposase [Candidatus Angelobacter sp.]